jgi:hypothetical protein
MPMQILPKEIYTTKGNPISSKIDAPKPHMYSYFPHSLPKENVYMQVQSLVLLQLYPL